MKRNVFLRKISLLLAAALTTACLSVNAFAQQENSYDMEYYSQLAGKDVAINVYN